MSIPNEYTHPVASVHYHIQENQVIRITNQECPRPSEVNISHIQENQGPRITTQKYRRSSELKIRIHIHHQKADS